MSSYASRIAKLETRSDDGQFRFVWLNEGESNEEGWKRYLEAVADPVTAEKARAAGRLIFFSPTDAKL